MKLTQKEIERTVVFSVAEVARRRWKRGIVSSYCRKYIKIDTLRMLRTQFCFFCCFTDL